MFRYKQATAKNFIILCVTTMVPNNASNLCSNDIYFLQIWQYALTAKLRAANKHTIRLILDSLVVWETTVKNKRYSAVFFKIGIHSMQGWTATTRHGVTRKRSTKRLKHTGNHFRENELKPFRL